MLTVRADAVMRPDEQQGPVILGATLTVTLAALITMITRLYVRVKVIRNVGWDDYVMVSAMALSQCVTGQCVVIPQVYYGAGRHIEYIEPSDFSMAFKLNFISQPLYLFAIALVKISVGFFLLRIAVQAFYRRAIISIMIFMGVYTIGCFFTIVLQCTDLRVMWDPTIKGTCWTSSTLKILGYTNSALNISTDLAFSIFIPIPMLWSVQMNRRQKASLICILGLGIFASAAALAKLTYLPNYGRSGDWLWDSRNLTIWTVTECNVGIVAGNLPCLKPIFRSILGSTYGHGSRKTSQPYLTGPYGAGTNHRSIAKNYESIHSNRTGDGEFKTYGAAGEAYMLTTIDANRHAEKGGDSGSKSTSGRSSPARESTENIIRSPSKAHAYNGLGRIAVTTEVDVTESIYEIGGGARQHRHGAKHLV
ncbi:hypothetical protein T440DRAFT_526926 [Plenodomus tracheiphilus IPT5]|uniref:Rhodopsin domain-containing protein n=1 Tax=Plenodomus tracheiphilus IPT5 TaxID=1408161 RepID=A0A6A7BAG3_9PLEO|nr:hypothetical protein T440DRAFT_526926 [Plenodomus tracheiphilus IPT5]